MRCWRNSAIGLLLTLLSPSWGQDSLVQPAGSGVQDLTLQQAVSYTLENNYGVQIAELDDSIAGVRNNWMEAGAYPSLTFSLTSPNSIRDNGDNPVSFIQGRLLNSNLSPALDLRWTIFNGFYVKFTKQNLELMERLTQGNVLLVMENTIHSVMLTYTQARLLERRLDVFARTMEFDRQQITFQEYRKEVGVVNSVDLMQFQNQFLRDTTIYTELRQEYRNTLRSLNQLMNVPLGTSYNLVDSVDVALELVSYNVLKDRMLKGNPNLLNQLINIKMQQTETEIAKSGLYPRLDMNLGYTNDKGWFKFPEIDQSGSTFTQTYYLNFTLSYTIFDNLRNRRAVQVSRIREDIVELETDQLEQQLSLELANAYERTANNLGLVQLAGMLQDNAIAALQLGEEQYRQGLINSFNLTDLKRAAVEAANNYISRYSDLVTSQLDILRLTGDIINAY